MESASKRPWQRIAALLVLTVWAAGCGVRANPRPPLPETYAPPATTAGPDGGPHDGGR